MQYRLSCMVCIVMYVLLHFTADVVRRERKYGRRIELGSTTGYESDTGTCFVRMTILIFYLLISPKDKPKWCLLAKSRENCSSFHMALFLFSWSFFVMCSIFQTQGFFLYVPSMTEDKMFLYKSLPTTMSWLRTGFGAN